LVREGLAGASEAGNGQPTRCRGALAARQATHAQAVALDRKPWLLATTGLWCPRLRSPKFHALEHTPTWAV